MPGLFQPPRFGRIDRMPPVPARAEVPERLCDIVVSDFELPFEEQIELPVRSLFERAFPGFALPHRIGSVQRIARLDDDLVLESK